MALASDDDASERCCGRKRCRGRGCCDHELGAGDHELGAGDHELGAGD